MSARKIRLIRVSGYDLLGLSGCLAVSIPRRPFNGTLRIARGRYTTRKRGCHLEETRRTWYGITWRLDRWQTVVFMVLLNILRVLEGLNIIPLKGEAFSSLHLRFNPLFHIIYVLCNKVRFFIYWNWICYVFENDKFRVGILFEKYLEKFSYKRECGIIFQESI